MKTQSFSLQKHAGPAHLLLRSVVPILVLALLSGASGCGSRSGTPVYFEDANLENAIRSQEGFAHGPILDIDLAHMTRLIAGGLEITSLEGLQYCTNLVHLNLAQNEIEDLTPISGLTGLEELAIRVNRIRDISALAKLTRLVHLELHDNEIADLSPLAGLVDLELLAAQDNRISSLEALAALTSLRELTLQDNQIEDISPLAHHDELHHLWLWNNRVNDVTVIETMVNLITLRLENNRITDIQPLVDNPGIDYWDIVHIEGNYLDLMPGSIDAINIEILDKRGVQLSY